MSAPEPRNRRVPSGSTLVRNTLFRRAVVSVAVVGAVSALAVGSPASATIAAAPTATTTPAASATPTPTATADPTAGAKAYTDVAYVKNGNSQQILDLWVPTKARGPVPVIVYVHGGGWGGSSKSELQGMAGWSGFLSQGFAVASIDYTLVTDTTKFPQQIYDVKAAIRYLRANAGRYHLDGNIGLWGGSAGGQLVALAGATCGVTPLEGNEGVTRVSSCVQAVVDMSGPTDFLQMDDHLLNSSAMKHNPATSAESQYVGCTDGLLACPASTVERANPITYLTSSSKLPAFLLAHGDADPLVPYWETEILFKALTGVCADVSFYTLHGADHFFPFSGALNPPYPAQNVQSSKKCSPVTTTDGPALSWSSMATFFHANLR